MNLGWTDSEVSNYHLYDKDNGRVLGLAFKYASQNVVWCAKIYRQEIPFNNDSEVHLGQFVGMDAAKRAIENYWEIQSRTLLE
jgi:hypothetical protein